MICSVDIMRRKLDSENLGIILLNAFMDEFFPKEESSTPDMFPLYHYNGLPHSNVDGRVMIPFLATFFIYKTKLSGAVSGWSGDPARVRFEVDMRVEPDADVSADEVAEHRSELVR